MIQPTNEGTAFGGENRSEDGKPAGAYAPREFESHHLRQLSSGLTVCRLAASERNCRPIRKCRHVAINFKHSYTVAVACAGVGCDLVQANFPLRIDNPRCVTVIKISHIETLGVMALVLRCIGWRTRPILSLWPIERPDVDTSTATGQE